MSNPTPYTEADRERMFEASEEWRAERDANFFWSGLDEDSRKALCTFIERCFLLDKRDWKRALLDAWMCGGTTLVSTEVYSHLHRVRNTIGHRFLYDHASGEMPRLVPGDGITFCGWSDTHPLTVVKVTKSGLVTARRDKSTLLNGCNSGAPDALTFTPGGFAGHTSGTQRWRIERDPDGTIEKCSWRKRAGRYVQKGMKPGTRGSSVRFGRGRHYDFNF
jgi:hypothetical protein